MSELKKKIKAKMENPSLAALATLTADGKPWVRYVTPFFDHDLNIWFATNAPSRKVAQIRANPEVHLTVGATSESSAESYLQIQGRAQILSDPESKKACWFEQLGQIFSGPDDPAYVVCKITPYRIEYQSMDLVPPEIWTP